MSKLSSLFLLICVLYFIGVQECHGVMKVQLQDSLIQSVLTAFDDNENINYAAIPQQAQYYKDNNIKVIYVASYYGGGPSIPLNERKRLVEAWVEEANCHGFDILVEVGAMAFVETLEMARFCSKLNITAITAFAEIIYQATTIAEATEDLQRICDATGSNLPLIYHELIVVDQNINTVEVFKGAVDNCVSCFVGVITSINSFLDIKASVSSTADYLFIDYGVDAIAAALKVGMNATENINLFPDLSSKIKDAVNNCQLDYAADVQQELNRKMYAITNLYGGIPDQTSRQYFEQSKAASELLTGMKVGYRYPLVKPKPADIEKIRSNLQGLGVRLYSSDNNK